MKREYKIAGDKEKKPSAPFFSFDDGGIKGGFSFFVMETSFLLLSIILQSIAHTFSGSGSAVFSVVSALSLPAALIITLFVNNKLFSVPVRESLSAKKFKPAFSLFSAFLSLSLLTGLGFINYVFVDFLTGIGVKTSGVAVEINGFLDYCSFVLSLCVFPAVFEEAFFRGVILYNLKRAGTIAACFVSALFFAFYHCSLAQFLYQFFFGFFLAFLTFKAGSVFPAVIAHFINNFLVLTLEFAGVKIDFYNLIYILSGIAALIVLTALLVRVKVKPDTDAENDAGVQGVKGETIKAIVPFGALSILLCAIVMVGNAL